MSGPLAAAGAQSNPTRYGALNMGGEQFTGLYTQRSPYRDAATAYLIKKFYQGSRFDSIWDGFNREISVKLTDVRRPGSPVWNASTWPAVLGYYGFKYILNGVEVVRVMVDTATAVYDGTGGGKTLIFTKSAGAGPTRFLSVGATLYMTNGVDSVKWVRSGTAWAATTNEPAGTVIVDTNNNLQVAIGAQTATITNIQVVSLGLGAYSVTLFFAPSTPISAPNLTSLTLAGLTTVTALNGLTVPLTSWNSPVQVSFTHGGLSAVSYTAETGTATTGTGITGSSQPAWGTVPTPGAVTIDAGAQWVNRGSAVQQWGLAGPTSAPTVTQTSAPSIYPSWAANTWYGALFVILVSGVLYKLTTGGTTAGTTPSFNPTLGATTADGSCVWTSLGPAAWAATTAYAAGAVIEATFTYYVTSQQYVYGRLPSGYFGYYLQTVQTPVTVTCIFECVTPGTSASAAPAWVNGIGTTVTEITGVAWQNQGYAVAYMGATSAQKLSTAPQIVDANNNVQTAQGLGESGATAPGWNVTVGGMTTDNTAFWLNSGPDAPANTGVWIYAYSGYNSVTGDISTASMLSSPILVTAGNAAVIQGNGMPSAFDQIILWRTAQGQSTPLYDSAFPNPGTGQQWIYTDTTPDTGLNALMAAPVALSNNPPPTGFTGAVWYLQRVWGFVDNLLYYSGGPDTLVGNGNDAFPPLNVIPYIGTIVKVRPITVENGALLVYTTSGIWIVLGTGTASNPFYTTLFCDKVNLGGYNVEDVVGSEIFLMEANGKVSSITIQYPFNPQSGYSEVGLPIGDQFRKVTTGGISSALYNPATAFLSWCVANTQDTGMYVADGTVGWFRMSAVSPPESGLLWSPRAGIVGGTSAVQSVETSPGVYQLLIGPPAGTPGPILMRDTTGTVFTDNGTAYDAYDTKGVNLLCSTGQVTEVAHISAKSAAVGSRPVVSVLLGEIAASTARPFAPLAVTGPDPATTPRSKSVFSDRYDLAQNGVNSLSDCILVKFDYGTQAAADELYDWGIFASTEEERKEEAAKS